MPIKMVILFGVAIIIAEIVSLFAFNPQTFLAFSTGLFFFLMSSFVNLAKYRRLFIRKDFSPVVFLAILIFVITIPKVIISSEVNSFFPSLFLPTDIAFSLANVLTSVWLLRSVYVSTNKKFIKFNTSTSVQFWLFMGSFFISTFIPSSKISIIGLLIISSFLTGFKISVLNQVHLILRN